MIIMDCPPGSDQLERQVLVAADIALVCTNAHTLGILGAERVLGDIEHRQDRRQSGPTYCALVVTQVYKSRTLDKSVPESLLENLPNLPQFSIGQNTDLSWAGATGTPFMNTNPNTKAIKDIEALARWIVQKTVVEGNVND